MKYSETVNQLTTLGDPREKKQVNFSDSMDYTSIGISEKDIPELIEMLNDEDLYYQDSDNPEVWSSLHAWRALGQLRAKKAIPPLINLLDEIEDNDWLGEELPEVFGLIGEEGIEPLKKYLYDDSKDEHARAVIANSLERIAENIPSKREECIEILCDFLSKSTHELETLNGLIASYLVDLKAIDKINVIKEAYDKDIIDCCIQGDFEDVEIELGLRDKRSTPQRNYVSEKYSNFAIPVRRESKKIGRNEPCPCGSGKKYKKCCLNKEQ